MAMLALSKSIGMASLTRIRPVMSRLPDMTITGMENEVSYLLHSRTPKKITHNDSSHLSRSSPGFQLLAAAALVVMGAAFVRTAARESLVANPIGEPRDSSE